MATETYSTICFECHSRCGVLLEVEDGRVVGIRGDKTHPHSQGYICPKGRACMEIMYHPDRITRPLVKVGGRDSGQFEETTWENALEIIAENLSRCKEKNGPESVVFGAGTTRGLAPYLNRFLSEFGSPTFMAPSNMSGGPVVVGSAATCGFTMVDPDYANSSCILLWAHNPEQSWPGLYMNSIREGLKNGARMIVIDPRGTRLAQKADHWLQIRPGTDVALVLSFLHVIIQHGLYDKHFVENWCSGFDRLVEHVSRFTPDKVSKITWIPPKDIVNTAVTFAKNSPAAIGPGMAGVCQHNDAFDLNRALTILSAITGNLAVPGGNLQCTPPTRKRSCYGPDFDTFLNLPEEQAGKKLGLDRFSLLRFIPIPSPPQTVWPAIEKGEPYPVRAVGLFANNSVCAYPNSARVRNALRSLDFLFAVDYFHTPTTELADVILPPAHWAERDDVEDLLMMNHVMAQPRVVEPVPECRDEKQILIDLAEKLGLDGFWKSVEEILDYRLEPINMSWEEFKKEGRYYEPIKHKMYEQKGGFRTPSGKAEIYAEFLQNLGISPLPQFREPPESPESTPALVKDYPLVLTTGGRNIVYYHSSHRNIPSLRMHAPDPELQINPATAGRKYINDGEWVDLVSPRGRVEIKARFDETMHPRIVHSPHGFWHGVEKGWKRININMLTDDENLCPVTGSVPIKSLLCRVEKKQF